MVASSEATSSTSLTPASRSLVAVSVVSIFRSVRLGVGTVGVRLSIFDGSSVTSASAASLTSASRRLWSPLSVDGVGVEVPVSWLVFTLAFTSGPLALVIGAFLCCTF